MSDLLAVFDIGTTGARTIIFDINGKEIDTLVDKYLIAGEHKIKWRAKGLASGIYFYRLQAGTFSSTKKMILLR